MEKEGKGEEERRDILIKSECWNFFKVINQIKNLSLGSTTKRPGERKHIKIEENIKKLIYSHNSSKKAPQPK